MTAVRSRDTKPEMLVRCMLHKHGYRFRLHKKELPGTPDIVLPKHKAVIFIHGCFWHGHPGCKKSKLPTTRVEFWETKIQKNIDRDHTTRVALLDMNWRVAIIWGCALSNKKITQATMQHLRCWLQTGAPRLEMPMPEAILPVKD